MARVTKLATKPVPATFASVAGSVRSAAVLSVEVIDAFGELVAEVVAAEMTRLGAAGESGPRWLTVEQAAERLGCSPAAVRMRARRGRLQTRRHGRRVYVSATSVDELG